METYLNGIYQTALILYQLSIDMDYADYSETRDETLKDICNALEIVRANAMTTTNQEFWKTFARCLDLITDNTELNENIFKD